VIPLKAALPKARGSLFGKNIQLGAKPPTGMLRIPVFSSETFGSERKAFEFFYK